MPVVRMLRRRGATVIVEAHAEVLVAPGGRLDVWKRRFSNNVTRFASEAAPRNKRPRWAHYGKPLRKTITSSTQTVGSRMHFAVGSTSDHALYVDQGTNSFNAKILPPWTRNSPSLYEASWKVPKRGGVNEYGERVIEFEEVGTIRVRGQRAQRFMQKGIDRAFRAAHLREATSLTPYAAQGLSFFPTHLTNFVGATPWSFAFDAQLREWRLWRDAAWRSGRVLGLGINKERQRREYQRTMREAKTLRTYQEMRERDKVRSRERSRAYRDRQRRLNPPKTPKETRSQQRDRAIKADRSRLLNIARKRYPDPRFTVSLKFSDGKWTAIVSLRGYVQAVLTSSKRF